MVAPSDTATVLGPAEGLVQFVGRPHPLRNNLVEHQLPAGLSIVDMLEIAIPDPVARRFVNVFIGGELVPANWHARLRPKPGTRVEFRAWVREDLARSLLTIAVLVVAAWAGPAGAALLSAPARLARSASALPQG